MQRTLHFRPSPAHPQFRHLSLETLRHSSLMAIGAHKHDGLVESRSHRHIFVCYVAYNIIYLEANATPCTIQHTVVVVLTSTE